MKNDVTFVLTSCCRNDLLDRTISSFFVNNEYPIKEYILIDDGEDKDKLEDIRHKYQDRFKIIIEGHKGHLRCVDQVYAMVNTEFIFHCQDDWLFSGGDGFIQSSMDILEEFPDTGLVWIRRDDLEHPLLKEIHHTKTGVEFQKPVPGWLYNKEGYREGEYHEDGWFGFSFNPGLRRKSHYDMVKPYLPYGSEKRIGWKYHDLGLETVALTKNYVTHIGWGRSSLEREVVVEDIPLVKPNWRDKENPISG